MEFTIDIEKGLTFFQQIMTGIELYMPEAKLWIGDYQFLGKTFAQVKNKLNEMNITFKEQKDGTGINIMNDSVRFYIPDIPELVDLAIIKAVYISFDLNRQSHKALLENVPK